MKKNKLVWTISEMRTPFFDVKWHKSNLGGFTFIIEEELFTDIGTPSISVTVHKKDENFLGCFDSIEAAKGCCEEYIGGLV